MAMFTNIRLLKAKRLVMKSLIAVLAFVWAGVIPTYSFAQDTPVVANPDTRFRTREYRPLWNLIPDVRSPSFSYGAVHPSRLIAESSQRLDYLSVNNLIVGYSRGYQVLGPDGELFFLDDIDSPNCGVQIVGQQVRLSTGEIVVSNSPPSNPDSLVFIDTVDFSGCR